MNKLKEIEIIDTPFEKERINKCLANLNKIEYKNTYAGYEIYSGQFDDLLLVGIKDAGYIIISEDDSFFILKNSYILPKFRGKNIRNILIKYVIDELKLSPLVSDSVISNSSLKAWNKLNLNVKVIDWQTKEVGDLNDKNYLGKNKRFIIEEMSLIQNLNKIIPSKLQRENAIKKLYKKFNFINENKILLYENVYDKVYNQLINKIPLLEELNTSVGEDYLIYETTNKFFKNKETKIIEYKSIQNMIRNENNNITKIIGRAKNDADAIDLYLTLKEDGRIVKGVNTTVDVDIDETPKQAKKFGNKVSKDGYPVYSFKDSVKLAGKSSLTEALEKIEEIYVGNFELDDHEISYFNSKLKRGKNPKIIKSGNYEIKIVKWPEGYWVVGIEDIAFIVVSKESDLKYLQWTRSYVSPDNRGKGILELLVKTTIDHGLSPLLTDYTLSLPAAKHFNKILSSPNFKVHIYDTEEDKKLPYEVGSKIYHSPEGELGGDHVGADYEDAEKLVWMIESKDCIDIEQDEILNEIKNKKVSLEIDNNSIVLEQDTGYSFLIEKALEKIEEIFEDEIIPYTPSEYEEIYCQYHDNSKRSINEAKEVIRNELKKASIPKNKDKIFIEKYGVSFKKGVYEDMKMMYPNKLRIFKESIDGELDALVKQHFTGNGKSYFLKIDVDFDHNIDDYVFNLTIIKNKSNKPKLNTLFSHSLYTTFDYKEEIKKFIFNLKLLKGNEYTINVKGIPIEDLNSNYDLNEFKQDILETTQTIKEGGGAFKNPKVAEKLRRIKREEIDKTIHFLADNFTSEYGMDYNYLKSHMMGSAGKQADSGDLDIVTNSSDFNKETLKAISRKVKATFGQDYSREDGLNAGHLNLAIPIEGDEANGYIQVDLLLGQPEWMKFTHHSPGSEVSKYKGVFISQALGVIARMKNIWKHRDKKGERVGEINWAYDLEKGLHVRARLRKQPGQGLSSVTPDEFESFPWEKYGVNPPRVPRYGYIDNPEAVVKILLGNDVKPSDIDTFEKLMAICKKKFGSKYPAFVERLKDSLKRSSAQAGMPKMAIDDLEIFKT